MRLAGELIYKCHAFPKLKLRPTIFRGFEDDALMSFVLGVLFGISNFESEVRDRERPDG